MSVAEGMVHVATLEVHDARSRRAARAKLHFAAQRLGLDAVDAARVAAAVSEACHRFLDTAPYVQLDVQLGTAALRIGLSGRLDDIDAAGLALARGFDQVSGPAPAAAQVDAPCEVSRMTADVRLRRGAVEPSASAIAAARAVLEEKSRDELMREVKAQNAALARHRDELEERVRQRTGELEQALQGAEQANRAKTVFLSSMSHELRTPLNGVLGYAELLQHDAGLGLEHREKLSGIESCAKHLLGLISDLLDFSKIESGRMEFEFDECEVGALVTAVVDIVRSRVDAAAVRLELDNRVDTDLLFVADEAKLRQVLVNLLGNSAKFTAAGEIRLRVEQPDASRVMFTVSDTGPGISAAELDSLFEPFRQGQAGLHSGGTGLGLSITKRIVEAMEGEICVSSQQGVGSTFTVTLPRISSQADRRVQRFESTVASPAEVRAMCALARAEAQRGLDTTADDEAATQLRDDVELAVARVRRPFAEGVQALGARADVEALRYVVATLEAVSADLDALEAPPRLLEATK